MRALNYKFTPYPSLILLIPQFGVVKNLMAGYSFLTNKSLIYPLCNFPSEHIEDRTIPIFISNYLNELWTFIISLKWGKLHIN